MRMKIYWILGIVSMVGIAVLSFIFFRENEDVTVLEINHEPVSLEEFQFHMNHEIAYVYNYFYTQHGVEDEKGFWKKEYGGERPFDVLSERTIDKLTRSKIEQILAKDQGLIEDISFETFLKNRDEENARRKNIVENPDETDEILYGTQHFGVFEYFEKTHGDMLEALRKKLSKGILKPDDDVLKERYITQKEYYKVPNDIQVKVIQLGVLTKEHKAIVTQILDDTKEATGDTRFNNIEMKMNAEGVPFEIEEKTFNGSTFRSDLLWFDQVLETANTIKVGSVSQLITERDDNAYIIMPTTRKDNGYQSFEEVKDNIIITYTREQLNGYVDEKVSEASVQVKPVIETIKVR